MSSTTKILIIKISSLGDVVHAMPAVCDLARNVANVKIDWLVDSDFSDVPKWHKNIGSVIDIPLRKWKRDICHFHFDKFLSIFLNAKKLIKMLLDKKYDYIIDAQGILKSAVLGALAANKFSSKSKKCTVFCGYDSKSIKEPLASIFYDQKFSVTKNQHATSRIRMLLSLIFGYGVIQNTQPSINYGIDVNRIYAITSTHFINENVFTNSSRCSYCVFIHTTSKKNKCWKIDEWIKLAKLLDENNIRTVIPCGINEKEMLQAELTHKNVPNFVLFPKSSISELAKIILKAKFVISVDTGLGHVAAALNVPIISLYGNTDPSLIGTTGTSIVIHLMNFEKITADDVLEKVFDLLEQSGNTSHYVN